MLCKEKMSNACTCKAAAAGMCWLGAGQGRDISVTTTPAQDGERGDTEWNKRSKKTPSKLPVEETWTQQQHLVEPPGSSWLLLSWWDGSSQSRAELGVCACLHTPECAEPEQTQQINHPGRGCELLGMGVRLQPGQRMDLGRDKRTCHKHGFNQPLLSTGGSKIWGASAQLKSHRGCGMPFSLRDTVKA